MILIAAIALTGISVAGFAAYLMACAARARRRHLAAVTGAANPSGEGIRVPSSRQRELHQDWHFHRAD